MKKEEKLWFKKLKFLFGLSISESKEVDLVKYSSLSYFKRKAKENLKNFNFFEDTEAYRLLLLDENNKKFKAYMKIIGKVIHYNHFVSYLCKNGSKEQILNTPTNYEFVSEDVCTLANRFDDDFVEQFLKTRKSRYPYSLIRELINKGYEKSLLIWFDKWIKGDNLTSLYYFEDDICNCNLPKLRELFLSSNKFGNYTKKYIARSKDKERIKQLLENFEFSLDLYQELLDTQDAEIQMLTVKQFLKLKINNRNFVSKLILTGNVKAITEYISSNVLDKDLELLLVKNLDEDMIRHYLEKNDKVLYLSNESMQYIFDHKSVSLQEFIFHKFGYPYELERKLLKSKDNSAIEKYIKDVELFSQNEYLLLKFACEDIVFDYISRYGLCESAEVYLIKYSSPDTIKRYLTLLSQKENTNEKLLHKEALITFVLSGEVEDIISYIKSNNILLSNVIWYFLLRGDEKLIEFGKDAITTTILENIAKDASSEQLIRLFNNKHIVFNDIAQCNFCKRPVIMLCDENSREGFPPIIHFIQKSPLCPNAQKLLFEDNLCNKDVIRSYISLYPLDTSVEYLLCKPIFADILEEYIEKYPIAEKLLTKHII